MIAILKREWKSYFQNITGWLFIAAVLALYGLYFLAYNLRAGYPYAVSYTHLIQIIILMSGAQDIVFPVHIKEAEHGGDSLCDDCRVGGSCGSKPCVHAVSYTHHIRLQITGQKTIITLSVSTQTK